MEVIREKGLVSVQSTLTVDEIVDKLVDLLESKGIKLFALIDHSGEAESVSIPMPPTKLLIFGNPKAGTPLMLAEPTTAIDLPLKILVWEDRDGHAWVSYNDPDYLRSRHGFPEELVSNIAAVGSLAKTVAGP